MDPGAPLTSASAEHQGGGSEPTSSELYGLSLEEILNLNIQVSSTDATTVFETPSTVQVIDRAMLDVYAFTSLADALSTVSGMHMFATNFMRDMPTARGLIQYNYSNKVLVMINGVPVWEPGAGDGVLNRVDINDLERIEVLKGPASVLYGSNAYTGAINLVLKKRSESGVEGQVSGGYRNRLQSGARAFYNEGKFSLSLFGSIMSERRARYPYPELAPTGMSIYDFREEYENRNITANISYGSHNLLFNHFDNVIPFLGVNVSHASGAGTRQYEGYLLSYGFNERFTDKWNFRSSANYEFYSRENFRNDRRSNTLFGQAQRFSASVRSTYEIVEPLTVEVGADTDARNGMRLEDRTYTDNTVRLQYNFDDRWNYESSAYGQLHFKYGIFGLSGGSRYTYNDLFGGNVASHGSAVVRVTEKNSIKASVGQSFRSPSLLELYWGDLANPALKPEKAISYELSFVTSPFKNLFAQVTGYQGNYTNFIKRVMRTNPMPPLTSIYANTSTNLTGRGAEVEIKYRDPAVVDSFLSYSFITGDEDYKMAPNDYPFRYVPKHTVAVGLSKFLWRNMFVSTNALFWSGVVGFKGDIGAQHRLDATMGFSHEARNFKLTHTLSAKNITNSDFLQAEYAKLTTANAVPTEAAGVRLIYTLMFRM